MHSTPSPSKQQFSDEPLTITGQLQLLKSKGLTIEDELEAEYWLSQISYLRFKNYSLLHKDYTTGNGNYLAGTTFNEVLQLYRFDQKLKMLVFEALENIEVAMKTLLSNTMSLKHGAHWYVNDTHFISQAERKKLTLTAHIGAGVTVFFSHEDFMKNIEEEMEAPEEPFLKHYKKNYEPIQPPSWMMTEIISFGTLSRMFENLQSSEEKEKICNTFNLTKKHLTSWLHCLSFIRNRCAHHARLIYNRFTITPSLPAKRSRQFLKEADDVDNNSLYAVLCCIQYLLEYCNRNSNFRIELLQLLKQFPELNLKALGFTSSWEKEDIWLVR